MDSKEKNGTLESATALLDKISEPIRQRASSPFWGSLILSWSMINWRPITYFIFSESSVEEKIKQIEIHFYPTKWENGLFYLVLPLFFAFLYSVGNHWLTVFIGWVTKNAITKKEKHTYDLNINQWDHQIRYAEKMSEFESTRVEYVKNKNLSQELDRLNNTISEKDQRIAEYEASVERLNLEAADGRRLVEKENSKQQEIILDLREALVQKDVQNQELKAIEAQYQSVDADRSKLREEREKIIENVRRKNDEIGGLKHEVNELKQLMTVTTKSVNEKDGEVALYKMEIQDINEQLLNYRSTVAELEKKIAAQNERLEDNGHLEMELRSIIEEQKTEIGGLFEENMKLLRANKSAN